MITLTLTEKDMNAIVGFIDVTLKATGLQAMEDCARIMALLKAAAADASAPKADETPAT